MKHLRIYEEFSDDIPIETFRLKYRIGDYVKYDGTHQYYIFKISDVDTTDYYKPYLITVENDSKYKQIVGDNYWVKESQLYTDEETELYTSANKYNL